ncbi:phage holin family protein [Pseudooceanicola nanhaiensis]|jgi:TRAP-type C4-dicarboxylate transport system permease small subunit|uniref:Nutrient deprivation-induced protein n=1 Tax=Pseudooceanicola nanhaiensis TaxID=375761 RepID=A0A917WCI1_9RHOB|nr:phage holin family protein [Pseudooceanicola nanhaiensis]GGL92794.1 nutrient deprivation-induced protein [Pseudooceanicola nanhaiensis]
MSDVNPNSSPKLLGDLLRHATSLVRLEIDLARAEVDQNLRRAGTALGLIVVAIVLLITALNVLAAALAAGLTELGLDPAWSALIVGVGFALVAWAMMHKGISDLKLSSLAPTRSVENVKRDADALKGAATHGE